MSLTTRLAEAVAARGEGAVSELADEVDQLKITKKENIDIGKRVAVKILSAERNVQPVQGGASPHIPSTVTLLVTQEQSLAINTAIPLGKLAFALRSLSDEGSWGDTRFQSERLKNLPRSAQSERISGYVELKDGGDGRSFALTHRGWVPTEAVPPGFLSTNQRQELSR